MKKKILIISFFVVIAVLSAIVFRSYVLYEKQKDPFKEMREDDFRKRFVTVSDFVPGKDSDLITYDSDKAKVTLKVPNDWELVGEDFGFVSLKTKDFVPLDSNWIKKPLASSGCWIEVNIGIERKVEDYQNLIAEYVKNEDYVNNDNDESEQVVDLGYAKALKTVIVSEVLEGETVIIQIPNGHITYGFDAYFFGKDKEKCKKDFDVFLDSLVIKDSDENT